MLAKAINRQLDQAPMEACARPLGGDSYLLELDVAVAHDREAQIPIPVYVVPIRDEIVPELRRVIFQNLFDDR